MTTTEADQRRALQTIEERLSAASKALDTLTGAVRDARHIVERAGAGRSWMSAGGTAGICQAVEEHEATLADLLAALDARRPHTLSDAETEALSAVVMPLLALLEVSRG